MSEHFVEFSEEPVVRPISVSPTIQRHRLTGMIDSDLCIPFTATISIEADSEAEARVLYTWFKRHAEEPAT